MIATLIGIGIIGWLLAGPIMSDVETPAYQVITSDNAGIEIRQYQPMIIAEVEVTGTRKDSISNGFRLLADYIFGNNKPQYDLAMTAPVEQQKIAMTTPVEQQKIAMTAPVEQQSIGKLWRVSFVMPAQYSMESLPEPNDSRVRTKEIPSKRFAVITFSGTNTDANIAKHHKQLMDYIAMRQLTAIGTPKYAFYNPPWTVPFMRRNEIMIEIPNPQ